MAFAVVAGITLTASPSGVTRLSPERIGTSGRAFLGGLLSSIRTQKRGWRFRTTLLVDADAVALETAVANGAHVSCSGDALGATVTCEVTVGDSQYVAVPGGFRRSLDLTLREV